jgi:hypothetical protein
VSSSRALRWIPIALLLAAALASRPALADPLPAEPPAAAADADRPWAAGVSKAEQEAATKLFDEATDLLKEAFFKRAVDLYREALTHWDHPAIHFNLAKALMNLDDPAAAYTELEASMRFGGAPLTDDQREQVNRYTKLLYETELAELVIETDEPGAKVTLDGVDLFVGPGKWSGVVRPETTKTLSATKTGFQTQQLQPKLIKGQVNTIQIEMVPLELVTRYVHEFDTWIPWAVLGSGVAILAGGGVMTWQTKKSFDDYDSGVAACNAAAPLSLTTDAGVLVDLSGQVGTCAPTSSLTSKKSQGQTFQTISTIAYAVGGATVATGIVLFIVNRERPITTDEPAPDDSPAAAAPVSVVPYFGPDQAGLTATFGF